MGYHVSLLPEKGFVVTFHLLCTQSNTMVTLSHMHGQISGTNIWGSRINLTFVLCDSKRSTGCIAEICMYHVPLPLVVQRHTRITRARKLLISLVICDTDN